MKTIPLKTLFILLCITECTYITAQSLPETDGKVIYQNLRLEKEGSSMMLSFDVQVSGKALNNRQSWTIIPELISTGQRQTALFYPSLLINGRQKERHYRRKMNFRNKELLANQPLIRTHVPQDEEQLIRYRAEIPYESWMEKSSLTFHQILTSPREKKQLFTTAPMAQLTPVPEPVAPPVPPVIAVQPPETKTLTIKGEAYIQFPVGETLVYSDYMDNIDELKKIGNELRKVSQEKEATLVSIQLTGYASPEGSFSLNEKLSYERTKRLKDYLVEWHGLPPGIIQVNHVAEDWVRLGELVEKSSLNNKNTILGIIGNDDSPDAKEKQLRAIPATWNTLLKNYFPLLRRVDYEIVYNQEITN